MEVPAILMVRLLGGCAAIVLACVIAVLAAVIASLASTGVFDELWGKGVGGAYDRAVGMPRIEHIDYEISLLFRDDSRIWVELAEDASDEDARRIWCEAFIPADAFGSMTRGEQRWLPPKDCGDPQDVPTPSIDQ